MRMEELFGELGLNKYETLAYTALLKKNPLDSKQLAEFSGLPYTSVYRVARSLIEKGLITKIESESLLFEPVKPEIGLDSLISKKIGRMNEARNAAIEAIQKLPEKIAESESLEKIRNFYGRDQRIGSLAPIINAAKEYVFTMCDLSCHWEEQNASARIKAKERGVELKSIATIIKPESLFHIKKAAKLTELRYYPGLDGLVMCVSDNRIVSAGIRNQKNRADMATIEIESPEFAEIYRQYFSTIWKKAKLIEQVL